MKITTTKNYELIAKLNKGVQDIHVKEYPEYFKEYDYESIKDFYKANIENENCVFLLIEEENEPKGYAWIEHKHYKENPFKKAYQSIIVHQLNIIEFHRAKGYGSYLMNEIYLIAEQKGISKVELDYWANNSLAQKFYRKHGFTLYREYVFKEI
ncbi:GNAT family N-acetyltransferase [Rossellomorea aquimaris]|uniref:GNAT family N-acetyltransferase n=1 Tax=Rossellomorea aquimaris TaxID=189382 RepID=UPI0007D07CE9|nr:GNAT family N-acetyltransferase [Rossellomorea aquimaris]